MSIEKQMKEWVPIEVDDISVGMGAVNMEGILPLMESIPDEFKQRTNEWVNRVDDWFFSGIRLGYIEMKAGIDKKKAFRHLQSIMHSWQPEHNHKVAGVAYLMSMWFEAFEYTKGHDDE
jgi:hypothetical protein